MNTCRTLISASLFLLTLASPVWAQSEEAYNLDNPWSIELQTSTPLFTGGLRVGKQLNTHFDVALLGIGSMFSTPVEDDNGTVGHFEGWNASAVIESRWYPWSTQNAWQPFVGAALGYTYAQGLSSAVTSPVYVGLSAGSHWQFNKNWALSGQLNAATANLFSAQLGVRYLL